MGRANGRRPGQRLDGDGGGILVLALLVALLLLGIGLTVMWVSSSGKRVLRSVVHRQEALYAADFGLERAREILRDPGWDALLRGTPCFAPQDPGDTRGVILCAGPEQLLRRPLAEVTSATVPVPGEGKQTYTVWIRNDWQSECDPCGGSAPPSCCPSCTTRAQFQRGCGENDPDVDTNGRVIVRAEGHGRDGVSHMAIEAILTARATGVAPTAGARGDGDARRPGIPPLIESWREVR